MLVGSLGSGGVAIASGLAAKEAASGRQQPFQWRRCLSPLICSRGGSKRAAAASLVSVLFLADRFAAEEAASA